MRSTAQRMAAALFVVAASGALVDPVQAGKANGLRHRADTEVSCTADRPTALPTESLHVQVWSAVTSAQSRYAWSSTAGRLTGERAGASWDFAGVKPGNYSATVTISGGPGERARQCSTRVIVLQDGGRAPGAHVTGRSVLAPGAAEVSGYGLYSYLLFANPPDETSRERYKKAIEAYLSLIPDLTALEKYAKPAELNATYVPIDSKPPMAVTAEWVLSHYDYARAVILLRALPGSRSDGPYIVSLLKPLSGTDSITGNYLLQDLSSVPADLVSAWVKLFINQASQEHFWESQTATTLALHLRTAVGILAVGLPDVQRSLTGWIAWSRSVGST